MHDARVHGQDPPSARVPIMRANYDILMEPSSACMMPTRSRNRRNQSGTKRARRCGRTTKEKARDPAVNVAQHWSQNRSDT